MNGNQKKVRVALAGLGRIGWQYHLPSIVGNDKFELIAVADTLQERLQEAADQFKVPQLYTSVEEMIEKSQPDLLVLTTPTFLHKEQCIFAFEHGVDVFCEKPLASNLEEAMEIAAAMKRTNRKIMLYQPHRFRGETNMLREIIASGKLGQIFMVRRTCHGYSRRNDWQSQKKLGGGMLNNYGAHFIDQFMSLFDNPTCHVDGCELRTMATLGDAEDVVKILLRTEQGIIGDIDINLACGIPGNEWIVYGKYGAARLDAAQNTWHIRYLIPEELPALELQNSLAAAGRSYASEGALPWHEEALKYELLPSPGYYEEVYKYFALDQKPYVPIEATLELMRINAECRRLAEQA